MADANLGGLRMPRQKKGGSPILIHTENANRVLDLCEALSNLSIRVQNADGTWNEGTVLITGKGLQIDVPYNPGAGTS